MLVGIITSFFYSNILYGQITIVLGLSIMTLWVAIWGDKLKKYEVKALPISRIGELKEGLVKIRGKLYSNTSIKSKLTNSNCIGYNYNAMKWFYKREDGRLKPDRFKIFESKTECDNFYIFDTTGKIKVIADSISILSDLNFYKIKKNKITYTENLLQSNKQEYYIIGDVVKDKQNKLTISKNKNKGLTIASPNEYNIHYTSKTYRIGCAIFLIIVFTIFFLFLFGNLYEIFFDTIDK